MLTYLTKEIRMFAFAVIRNSDQKKGSVVSDPKDIGDHLHVVVMWDDDLTFSTERVDDLTGNPVNAPKSSNLSVFPGGKDDGATSTH